MFTREELIERRIAASIRASQCESWRGGHRFGEWMELDGSRVRCCDYCHSCENESLDGRAS